MSNAPVGFFDSGFGGLSIWKEFRERLPFESSIYLADSSNAPYGEKSKEQIIALSDKNTAYLVDQGCKLIVVACNTATTKAVDYLRKKYQVPFIGIEPAIKPAALSTTTNSIGVLATEGTLVSELFLSTSEKYASEVFTVSQKGSGLVRLIENGQIDSDELRDLLKSYVDPMTSKNIDYLVLGCTHYPFLKEVLRELLPPHIHIIDSGAAVAKQIDRVIQSMKLEAVHERLDVSHTFFTNRSEVLMQQFMDRFEISGEAKFLHF